MTCLKCSRYLCRGHETALRQPFVGESVGEVGGAQRSADKRRFRTVGAKIVDDSGVETELSTVGGVYVTGDADCVSYHPDAAVCVQECAQGWLKVRFLRPPFTEGFVSGAPLPLSHFLRGFGTAL